MKNKPYLLLIFSVFIVVACSSRPSNGTIKDAIEKRISKELNANIVGPMRNQVNVLAFVCGDKAEQFGAIEYWPVKGRYQVTNPAGIKEDPLEIDVYIFKNLDGYWEVKNTLEIKLGL